jgi:hypothetical protein
MGIFGGEGKCVGYFAGETGMKETSLKGHLA